MGRRDARDFVVILNDRGDDISKFENDDEGNNACSESEPEILRHHIDKGCREDEMPEVPHVDVECGGPL